MFLRNEDHASSPAKCCSGTIALIVVWCLLVLNTTAAGDEPNTPSASDVSQEAFEPLFNRRDFDGWVQSGNWKIAEGAFYCLGSSHSRRNDLRYTARKIAPNCEIVFEWQWDDTEGVASRASDIKPGISFTFNAGDRGPFQVNSSYGAAIDYAVSDISVRVHTRDIDDNSPLDHMFDSGFSSISQTKHSSRCRGEWNHSRIRISGSTVETWINGTRVFAICLRNRTIKTDGEEDRRIADSRSMNLAAESWLRRERQGLYISVIAPYSDETTRHRVAIRSIEIRSVE
jgi:hypothetical protein